MTPESKAQMPDKTAPIVDGRGYIHGIGTAVPRHALTQDEAVARMRITSGDARTHRVMRHISRQSAVGKRHFAALEWQGGADHLPLYGPVSEQPRGPGMGVRNALFDTAAEDLIRRAVGSLPLESREDIGALVTVSCTHASSPGLERHLFEHFDLSPAIQRWNLGFMGCSAGLAALRLVHALVPGEQRALICTCELSSLHFQYSDAVDQITANLLFADGAAAVLVGPQRSAVAVLDCRCVHLPAAADQMVWFADDHGLRLNLSRELPRTLAAHLPAAVDEILAHNRCARQAVDHWLVHPGGPQILDAVESALALDPDALADSRGVLHDYGNMSSSTIFFILQRLVERREGGLCVALAFGPGLTIELAVLEISRD